ncbi:MAG: DUF1488 family protein [Rhodoferax sp.]|nr:DUF1488 family protein [Rhodoferax sp.]
MHFRADETLQAVEFSIDVDGEPVICWISFEALSDHFDANKETSLQALHANMHRIAPVAERLSRQMRTGERITVKTADL